ncbi:MAG: RNA polymerase sigma factor [Bdellovibrionales bacterium]
MSDKKIAPTENFEAVYYKFHDKIKRQIIYNAEPQYVDDISQEVFLKIYKNIDKFKNDSSFETWIYKITLNTCYDFLRKKQRNFRLLSVAKENLSTASSRNAVDAKIDLQEAVLKLDKLTRPVFTLYYFSELKIDAISSILDIPSGTVKSRLNKARNQIKEHFNMEDL